MRPGKFLPFLQPGLILRRIVHDERPFHAVMTEAAKLATDRAAALIREQLNAASEAALFESFVGELTRAAS